VFATLALIIPVIFLLAVVNMRLFQLSIIIGISAVILNFSYFTERNIVDHQRKSIAQVDARNYADWMNTIIESSRLEKQVYTNFKAISTEKIPGDLRFIFLNENELENQFTCTTCKYLIFLKTAYLKNDSRAMIDLEISRSNYKVLFDDGDYLLLAKQTN